MSSPRPDQMQAPVLDIVRQGQNAALTVMTTLSENWASALRTAAGLGSGGSGAGGMGMNALPKPGEAVDRAFDFGVQMLETQRAFAHSMIDAAGPVLRASEATVDSVAEKARTR